MSSKMKSMLIVASVVFILVLGAGAIALVSTSAANAQSYTFERVGLKFSNLVHAMQDDKAHGIPGRDGFPGKETESDSYLAEALGISVEELQVAWEKASTAAVEAAIQSGEITQEQAELIKARQALRDYIDPESLNAEVLGITVDELRTAREEGKSPRDLMEELNISLENFQAAMKAAHEAAIQQAVEDGVITQEQAELISNHEADFAPAGPGRRQGKDRFDDIQRSEGEPGFPGRSKNMDTYLAEALGLSVEELQAARDKASAIAMEAAIENGEITQEQADLFEARQALKGYLDQESLTAKALGISVEDLQAAREEGKSPRDLMDEQGISQEDFQSAMYAAYQAAIQQAVEDGVITQEQADLLLNSEMNFGPGGPGGFRGRGNMGEHPGFPGQPGELIEPGNNPPGMPGQNLPGGQNSYPGGQYNPNLENDI